MAPALLLPSVRSTSAPILNWLGIDLPLAHSLTNLDIPGYQLYAVEKWIVDRDRPINVLAVYTGDPSHSISVTAFVPAPHLSPADALSAWTAALHHLKRDGARPKDTPHGTLMATSLAHFRSDYTIVRIPDGNFLAARELLFTNINLLRMGCSGRSALTLQQPSDTTKDRFISTYHIPDPPAHTPSTDLLVLTKTRSHSNSNSVLNVDSPPQPRTKDPALFNLTVLELVRLIQTGLAIFGMYAAPSLASPRIDGLLCDATVDGIRKWILTVGDPAVGLEPMERIADPSFVAALFSLILATRNKLAALGFAHILPKDPFLQPHIFAFALATYLHSATPATPPLHQHHAFGTQHFGMGYAFPPAPGTPAQALAGVPLTRDLVAAIAAAYDAKARATEARGGMRRALRGKLEDLARVGTDGAGGGGDDAERPGSEAGPPAPGGPGAQAAQGGAQLLSGLASGLGLGGSPAVGAAGVLEGTLDLGRLVRAIVGRETRGKGRGRGKARERGGAAEGVEYAYGYGKEKGEGAGVGVSVRALWGGGAAGVARLRQREVERELAGGGEGVSRGGNGNGARARDRLALSDGDVDEPGRHERSDGRTTEEESDTVVGAGGFGGMVWGERVQRKLESWTTGLARKRGHMSLDLSPSARSRGEKTSLDVTPARLSKLQLPAPMTFTSSADPDLDDDDLLSSGQASPIEGLRPAPFHVLHEGPSESASLATTAEYDRRVSEFNMKRARAGRAPQGRITSWADPFSAREVPEGAPRRRRRARPGAMAGVEEAHGAESAAEAAEEEFATDDGMPSARTLMYGPQRRRSFHDLDSLRGMRIVPAERLRIDVELCGQLLIMLRRAEHLRNVISCLHILTRSLTATNALLREDYTAHQPALAALSARAPVLSAVDAAAARADKTAQAAHALRYEAAQLRLADLWHTAGPPRRAVLALREKVFGTGGRRLPAGVRGAHGRFDRVQWTLGGGERLVDYLGRTEGEAAEEAGADPEGGVEEVGEVEEEDVVEHPGIRPMWLLRFFASWGARQWSVQAAGEGAGAAEKVQVVDRAGGPSSPPGD